MTRTPTPLEKLFEFFGVAGMEPMAIEVAEMLWLARRLPASREDVQTTWAAPIPGPPPAMPSPRPPGAARQSSPPARAESFGPTVTPTSGPTTVELYPVQAGAGQDGAAARSIRSPAAFALPGSLEIGRSLRPLKRRVPSRSHQVLDEGATVHRIADTGDWTPVFHPEPERWLDIVVLVDESSSMIIWQRTIAELRNLLERQGAFRNIEILGFRASAGHAGIRIYTGIGPTTDRSRSRRPAELIDPLGRRLIAIVSDCVSPTWHNGVMASLLSIWGQVGLVTVVQVLPDRLWVRTGLRTYPSLYLRSPAPGAPNAQFEIEWTTFRPTRQHLRGTAIPVVSLEPLSLGYWARALAGNSNTWIPGVFAIPAAAVPSHAAERPAEPAAASARADQLVSLFYGTASPTARRLASFLAAVPLTLPVMRLVQRSLLPKSLQVHLAEVWLSGLIDRPVEIDDKKPADDVEYRFVNGVRELLLNNVRLGETLEVLGRVSNYVGDRLGEALDFGALIADPLAAGDVQIAQGYRSFAQVAATALRRFGGQYADLAQRLESSVYGQSVRTAEPASELKVEQRIERKAKPQSREHTITVRALLVGINNYASLEMPLMGAVNDVSRTRDWLQSQCGVSPSNITVLLDQGATKQAIVGAWRRLARLTVEGDQFFFHFSGMDQAIASSDPNEADGIEETLLAYDSILGDRSTLLTHQELADLATEVERSGGQAVLFLDSCRAASGLLSRRPMGSTLVFAGAAEAENSAETKSHDGVVSYFLAEAMQAYKPGMTWLDAYDYVFANVRASGWNQTPQLIGSGDLAVFMSERKPVSPYLLVTKADEREIQVCAPTALRLGAGESGARLAIYPPRSTMDEAPIGFARVKRIADNGVVATLESPVTVPVASRARLLSYGDPRPVIRAGLDDKLLKEWRFSPLVAAEMHEAENLDFTVSKLNDGVYALQDREGRIVWREVAVSDASPTVRAQQVRSVLEHFAAYLRTFALENPDVQSELARKVDLEVVAPAPEDVVTLAATESLKLRLRNRATTNLYISVWMLDENLGIQRIYPVTTACVLLGAEREVQLAVDLAPRDAGSRVARVSFKVFASVEPNDLSTLALPRLDQPLELGDLTGWSKAASTARPAPQSSRRKATSAGARTARHEDSLVPGGPVAVTAKLWKTGSTLRIKFLQGTPAVRERVINVALEWFKHANLRLLLVQQGDADLRVSFDQVGSWSYVGTDSASIPQNRPTINLGWLTSTTPEEEVRKVVLHEFGHALGLAASQQSPIAAIPWNKKATYEYYAKLGWTRETVDANVFMKYDPSEVQYGPADPHSIMYHPIPKETTDGKLEILQATELSEGDKKFIAQIYPHNETR